MKQKEVYLVYGEKWSPPSPLPEDDNVEQFSMKKWIQDEPCIWQIPKFDLQRSIFKLSSWKTTRVPREDATHYVYVGYGGFVFSAGVMCTFLYSISQHYRK